MKYGLCEVKRLLRKKLIFLVGYYGFGNVGDELLLINTKSIIREKVSDVKFMVLGPSKDCYSEDFVVLRWSMVSVFFAVWRAKSVVFGGGELFQDKSSRWSFYYYLSILILAKILKKKIIILGHGFGYLKKAHQKLLVFGLRNVDYLSVRDQFSYRRLVQMGVAAVNIVKAVDLGFESTKFICSKQKSLAIGLSLRQDYLRYCPNSFFKALLLMQKKLYLLSFQKKVDRNDLFLKQKGIDVAKVLFMETDHFLKPRLPVDFGLIISMRYHACVLAVLLGIPFIAILVNHKLRAIAEQFDQPILELENFHDMQKKLLEVSQNYCCYQKKLLTRRIEVPEQINRLKAGVKFEF